MIGTRPLPALLSAGLVAFTLEVDNAFEERMVALGGRATLSLVAWTNLLRFVGGHGVTLAELAASTLAPPATVGHAVGCLERRGFVAVAGEGGTGPRPGRGSTRGLRRDTAIRATAMGERAREIWPPLMRQIEARWRERSGPGLIGALRTALETVRRQVALSPPSCPVPCSPSPWTSPARRRPNSPWRPTRCASSAPTACTPGNWRI